MSDNDRQQKYAAVLEDIEQRIADLQKTAANIRELMGMAPVESGGMIGRAQELPSQAPLVGREAGVGDALSLVKVGDFYGKSYAEAAREFLKRAREAQTTQTILNALRKAQFELNAKNPASILYNSLRRHKGFALVSRNTWGLTEWYPDAAGKKKLESKPAKKMKRKPKRTKRGTKATMTEEAEAKE